MATMAMEALRLALRPFPTLVTSSPPSEVDRQLRKIDAALGSLLLPQDQQVWEEDAIHLLLDTFCQAHAADHMSDRMKLGSWRLPYVSMLHSYASLHMPLIRQLELFLHSSRAPLSPVQCSALSTLLLFMNPYQISPKHLAADEVDNSLKAAAEYRITASCKDVLSDQSVNIVDSAFSEDLGPKTMEMQVGDYHVRVCLKWRWEDCFRVQNVAFEDMNQVPDVYSHWMDQFWDSFPVDSETDILWAARFAASYLRNVAVFWEHIIFCKNGGEIRLLPDLTLQLKSFTLVGPIFVSYVPHNMLVYISWLQQRLDFTFQIDQPLETAALMSCKKERQKVELRPLVRELSDRTNNHDDDLPKRLCPERKKQCLPADTRDRPHLPNFLWVKESEANPAEVYVLQVILELSSSFNPQSEPWFLEVAVDCIETQLQTENGIKLHFDTCAYAHECLSREYHSRVCSAHRLKSCIAALPPSVFFSHDRSNQMGKILLFCWLGDGPFSLHFAGKLLSFAPMLKTTSFVQEEGQWKTFVLASWVRFFNFFRPGLVSVECKVAGVDLGLIMTQLHTMQQILSLPTREVCDDIDEFKVAATAMPQLAAITVIEALASASTPTSLTASDCFLLKFRIIASQQQHDMSRKALDIFRRVAAGVGLEDSCHNRKVPDTVTEVGARPFLQFLLLDIVSLLSTAALSCPNLIVKKWTTSEHKRSWVFRHEVPLISGNRYFDRENAHSRAVLDEGSLRNMEASFSCQPSVSYRHDMSKSTHISLMSLESEFDERNGNPQRSVWDILLEWAVSLISLSPDLINKLLINTKLSEGLSDEESSFLAKGTLRSGPQVLDTLILTLVVAGLSENTVVSFVHSESTKTSWTSFLSWIRRALEGEAYTCFLGSQENVIPDFKTTRMEMDRYLLWLQNFN